MTNKTYHVGLALRPTTVGYAAFDNKYHLVKAKGKTVIGDYAFDEAQNASDRRTFRVAKRLVRRRKWRLKLLERFFKDHLAEVDPVFLERIHTSDLASGDLNKHFFGDILFDDKMLAKSFAVNYPTIYHLRYALMTEQRKFDLREVFLAIHHIIKNRGHFLNNLPVSEFNSSELNLSGDFSNIVRLYQDLLGFDGVDTTSLEQIESLLFDTQLSNRNKLKRLQSLMAVSGATKAKTKDNTRLAKEFCSALIGTKANFAVVLAAPDIVSEVETKFSLMDADVDDKLENLMSVLTDKQLELLNLIKNIHNQLVLIKIIPAGMGLSESMIAKYDLHKQQLRTLKSLYSLMDEKQLAEVKKAYDLYIDGLDSTSDKIVKRNRITNEDLAKSIKKVLKTIDDDRAVSLLNDIELDNFLPKQRTKLNSVIPYQLHQVELDKIIENQAKYYPWLAEENPVKDHLVRAPYKLDELLSFKIPYYVGPLVTSEEQQRDTNADFAWMVRKEAGEITPYNFNEKVDLLESANRFIKRMIANDTYLLDELVLPDNSLLYQRFKVLNELNNLRVNDKPLSVGLKQGIYIDLFENGKTKTVSKKALLDYLKSKLKLVNDIVITGMSNDKRLDNTLGTYHDMLKIFDRDILANKRSDVEQIIEWITIFEDKKLLKAKLVQVDWLTSEQVSALVKLRYNGWGRFSHELLAGLVDTDGQRIIDVLWNTQGNINHILALNDFREAIFEHNKTRLDDSNLDTLINEAYISASVKKTTRKALAVVDDLVSVMNTQPTSISLEYRSEEFTKNDNTRVWLNQLDDVLNNAESTWIESELVSEFKPYLAGEKPLTDAAYLYFSQLGYDLYTGEKLDLAKLESYHVLPLVPIEYLYDDSMSNRVLTALELDINKLEYPAFAYGQSMRALWDELFRLELIPARKFALLHVDPKELRKVTIDNLTRYQLMESSYIMKFIAEIIQTVYPQVKLIKVLPKYPQRIREKLDLPLVPEVNDYQYGMQAYLVGVSGRYLYERYPKLRNYFVHNDFDWIEQQFTKRSHPAFNYFYDLLDNDELTEIMADDNLNVLVDKQDLFKQLTRAYNFKIMPTSREIISGSGALFNRSLYPVNPNQALIPKKNDKLVSLYGGYSHNFISHLAIARVETKKGIVFRVVGIPLRRKDELERLKVQSDSLYMQTLSEIVAEQLRDKKGNVPVFKVILPKLLLRTLVLDPALGGKFRLGTAESLHNAKQLVLSLDSMRILGKLNTMSISSIDDSELVAVYEEILEKVNAGFALYDINKFRTKLTKGLDAFKALDTADKGRVLRDILIGLHANATTKKIDFIGSTQLGRFQKINLALSLDAKIVYQSPTGLFERVVTLKDL